jgi:hypothetical protein
MSTIVLNSSINILPIFFAQGEKGLFQNVDEMKSERCDDEQKSRQPGNNNTIRQEKALPLTTHQEIIIFIDACNEAMDLAQQIEHDLSNIPNIFDNLLHPLDTSKRPSEIFQTLKKNVIDCDVIIVPFQENVPLEWLHTRMKYYNKMHIYREHHRPLYVMIFTQNPESLKHPKFKSYSSRLHIRECHDIQQCLKMEEK